MLTQLFIFAAALFLVVKGATMSTKHAERLAKSFNLSAYTVGFIVIAIISILPETFISINAVLEGIPSFGLGTLLGSNVADLTLVFFLIVLLSGRNLKVEGKILTDDAMYPFLLIMPLVLGLDGYFSRVEGVALVATGVFFYYLALKNGHRNEVSVRNKKEQVQSVVMLLIGMALLLVGAHYSVTSATYFAELWGVSPVLIGMLIVGLGTVMPEFLFSLRSVKDHDDDLAIGDLLGTVLADATIVIGIIALMQPFAFSKTIIYVAGVFMVAACFILFSFMRSGRALTKKEGYALFVFWLTFVLIEFIINH
ncbi:MAG: hypothetical protein AMXMBFR44_4650 [Candidatus Campbellbacteria bacterium]